MLYSSYLLAFYVIYQYWNKHKKRKESRKEILEFHLQGNNYQLWGFFPPTEQFLASENIFDCHMWACGGSTIIKVTAQHHAMHSKAPFNKEVSRLRNTAFEWCEEK